jgi:hypothetical protein
MLNKVNSIIKKIVSDNHTIIFIGVMLVIMGLLSLSENLLKEIFGIKFHIAYGYIFLGIFNILLAIAFMIMGAINIESGISEDSENNIETRIKLLESKVSNLEKGLENEKEL